MPLLYCTLGVTGSEIHLILECPATSHVALDLIQLLTTLLYDTCQPFSMTLANQIGASSPPTNKPPLSWVTPPPPFPKSSITCGCNQLSLKKKILGVLTTLISRSPREGVDTCRDRALNASGRGYYGQANAGRAAKVTHGTQVPS